MISPVTGPARLRMGSWSGAAPIRRKSGFTADWVRPKLNWTPKNPRFIISRALPVISGLRSAGPAPIETDSDVVVVIVTPSADAIRITLRCDANAAPGVPHPQPSTRGRRLERRVSTRAIAPIARLFRRASTLDGPDAMQ